MDKSVYSLVLMDDLVHAVDQLAYERSTSRSNLINQILAEYLSFSTPEMRMKNIFDCVEQMMADMEPFQVQFQPSDAMISIRSALRYRYNPTIRYALELYRSSEPAVGEVRISMRTQSQPLIKILTEFFVLWSDLEDKLIGPRYSGGHVPCRIEPGRFIRVFTLPRQKEHRTNEGIAAAIGEYISFFDTSLKYYFSAQNAQSGQNDLNTAAVLEQNYRDYMQNEVMI